jgi:hypothetical protein
MAVRTAYFRCACACARVCALLASGALAFACGGAKDSGLFALPSDDVVPEQNGHDAGAADGSVAPPPPDHDGGHPPPSDDGAPPHEKDADLPDTNPPPPGGDPGIRCGNTYCPPDGMVCCRTGGGVGLGDTFTCVPPGSCQQFGELEIPCDDAADCDAKGQSGDICCVTQNAQTGRAEDITCLAAADCNGSLQTNMCDKNAVDPCPNGGTCKPSQTTLPGYDICL